MTSYLATTICLRKNLSMKIRLEGMSRSGRGWQTSLKHCEPSAYEVIMVNNCFDIGNREVLEAVRSKKAFCIVDENVHRILGWKISGYFQALGQELHLFRLDASEKNKTLTNVERFMEFCLGHGMGRRDTVLCIGGGIVCDIGGMAASLIRRGVPCVKIPTTLLGMIDGSIGVKTGVNFSGFKNSIGTFSMPKCVFVDLSLLKTVPVSEIGFGLIEMAKILSLKSRKNWELFIENFEDLINLREHSPLPLLVRNSIRYMLDELESNLYEKNLYRIVDYGHEFGHCIESSTDYQISHAEAVLIGMCLSNSISLARGLMDRDDHDTFWKFASTFDLPRLMSRLSVSLLVESLHQTNLHKDGIFIVGLAKIAQPIFLKDIRQEELESAWKYCVRKAKAAPSVRCSHSGGVPVGHGFLDALNRVNRSE